MQRVNRCIQNRGLSAEFLAKTADLLKMLAHPHRLQIIEVIDRAGEISVSAIIGETALPQSSVSLHLNQMKRMDLLTAERHGREVRYRIKDPRVLKLLECICNSYHEGCGDAASEPRERKGNKR
jgi:DNA-binding transcriptional ArsR family regulator